MPQGRRDPREDEHERGAREPAADPCGPEAEGGNGGAGAQVAELAAQGMSNRLIGEALGLSTRTIDAHLSRVFAKWDLHARSELAGLF